MIEVTGDLWAYPADVRVITTNGTVKKNGECVMGRGCAWEAKQKYPGIAASLGLHIQTYGNIAGVIITPDAIPPINAPWIISFPVKHNWYEKADLALIKDSAQRLASWNASRGPYTVVLPRPGCGNGHLKWEDVRPVLAPILDNRFYVITHKVAL